MTAEAWAPQVVPGNTRLSRHERREKEMRELWAEALGLQAQGGKEAQAEAAGLFREANDLGRLLPTEENRACALTGTVAMGRARVPGTDFDADVAISHGADERGRTALDRWEGVDGPVERNKVKLVSDARYLLARLARTDGNPNRMGAEGALARLGAKANDFLVFDFLPDGRVVVEVERPSGPKPVEG
jgi:hypothetical protein